MKEIYDKIQDINIILKRSFIDLGKPLAYQEVVEKSAKVLESSLFIIDTKRNCLGYGFTDSDNSYQDDINLQNVFIYQKISKDISSQLLNHYEMSASLPMAQSILEPVKEISSKFPNKFLSFLPYRRKSFEIGNPFSTDRFSSGRRKENIGRFFINIYRESNVLYHAGRTGRAKTK